MARNQKGFSHPLNVSLFLYRSRQAARVVRMNLANLPGGEEVDVDVDHVEVSQLYYYMCIHIRYIRLFLFMPDRPFIPRTISFFKNRELKYQLHVETAMETLRSTPKRIPVSGPPVKKEQGSVSVTMKEA